MISPRQMTAARALLEMTQEALAEVSKTSANTIYRFEKGEGISFDKLQAIRRALEEKGIEFLGKDGVLRRAGGVKTYHGTSGTDLFYDDVLSTVKERGGIIAASFDKYETFSNALGATYAVNHGRIELLGRFAEVSCLLSNAQDSLALASSIRFRAIQGNPTHPFFSLIYGDKIAVIASDGQDFTYVVMHSVLIAQQSLKTFEANWATAFPFTRPAPLQITATL